MVHHLGYKVCWGARALWLEGVRATSWVQILPSLDGVSTLSCRNRTTFLLDVVCSKSAPGTQQTQARPPTKNRPIEKMAIKPITGVSALRSSLELSIALPACRLNLTCTDCLSCRCSEGAWSLTSAWLSVSKSTIVCREERNEGVRVRELESQ